MVGTVSVAGAQLADRKGFQGQPNHHRGAGGAGSSPGAGLRAAGVLFPVGGRHLSGRTAQNCRQPHERSGPRCARQRRQPPRRRCRPRACRPTRQPLYYNFQTAELTVGFVPDVFGGNRRQVESLAAQTEVQRYALEATYITLASNVAAAAIQEASLRAQIRATQEIIAADEKALRILRDQFRLGQAMRIDVAAAGDRPGAGQSHAAPAAAAVRAGARPDQGLGGQSAERGCPRNFRTRRAACCRRSCPSPCLPRSSNSAPMFERPQAQLHAANAQVGVAVAAMLPQFPITGSYGGNADQFSWMFRHGGPFWNLVGDMTQPLFEGGTLLHRKRAANQALQAGCGAVSKRGDHGLPKRRRHAARVAVRCRCA